MRVLQVSESLSVEFGGTAVACTRLADHLTRAGVGVSAIPLGDVCQPSGPRWLGYCRDMPGVVASMPPADLVHVHGLWRLLYLQAARYAATRHLPLVISTHGMLHPPALEQKAVPKQVGRWLYQDRLLRGARCLHVTSDQEAQEVRRAGFETPIAVIPWGVDMPAVDAPAAHDRTSTLDRTVLYLGRLHPSKGLELLLRAWADVCQQFPRGRLVIAGYDENGYRSILESQAADLGVSGSVTFTGPVDSACRERLFAEVDLLVLPSSFENFGFVVPEALVRGIPVIATTGAPWPTLIEEQCGWWTPAGVAGITAALREALAQPADVLRAMGERGRRFARGRFAWETTATAMMHLYTWLLDSGPAPAFMQN